MSYSLIGKIVDIKNKKVLCEADFDFLKNLNEYCYSRDLGGIEPTGTPVEDMEDITVSKYNKFKGHFKKDVLNELKDAVPYKKPNDVEGIDCYLISDEEYDKIAEKEQDFPMERILDGSYKKDKDIISIFVNAVSPLDGGWYRVEDFEKAKPNCEKELKTYRDKLAKLYEIKNDTVKWYNEMSSDARMEISDDIDCFEEMAIDYEWKIWALNKVINILEFFGENVIFDEDNHCGFGTPIVLYLYMS